ncbi:MAG: UDP-2,3-diacylglucosamine diphosphatase [Ignavibacteria bacterium]|nr:UDP-2,3-diacylglucosamine diphosphatase [Ignavibacteria bacterium]
MQKSVYFISDVHLGLGTRSGEREKENRLLSFLNAIRDDCRELFILGDLFDFWFEYKTVIPKGFHRTLSAIQEYTDGGIPVKYLAGNHDFWMGDFFHTELGVDLYRNPFEIERDGKKIFLHHGDGLARRDTGYRLIKPVLRNQVNIWLYRWLHPDLGVPLARGSSRSSRKYTGQKDYGETDGMVEFAKGKIAEGADIVIMGHRHQPCMMNIESGTYLNLGDWIQTNTYAVMKDGAIQLEHWGEGEAVR